MCFQLFSVDDRIDLTSVFNRAMGGPHTALNRGFDTFFNNPALISANESELTVFDLGVHLKGPVFSLMTLFLEESEVDMQLRLVENGLIPLLMGATINGPVSIGYMGKGLGVYFKNQTLNYTELPPTLTSPAKVLVREDIILGVGYSKGLSFGPEDMITLRPGIMVKAVVRGEISLEQDQAELINSAISDPAGIILNNTFYLSTIFGMDLGLNLEWKDYITLSVSLKDAYTPILRYQYTTINDVIGGESIEDKDAEGKLVPMDLSVGTMFNIPLGPVGLVLDSLRLYLDYFDMTTTEKNFWLHWGIGLEMIFFDQLSLMVGINEGLLSMGFNIDLEVLNIGFAVYGTEESVEPGVSPAYNLMAGMKISF